MNITLDQARALDAIEKHQTIQKAAVSLKKSHSAVMYLIRGLEEQAGQSLFDRTGYRNRLSSEGEVVLSYCRRLLATEDELNLACRMLRGGWEPSLQLVYDGVIDFNLIANALTKLKESSIPTEIKVLASFLHEVETTFHKESADIMLTILPIDHGGISFMELEPIKMLLIAGKNHPLAKTKSQVSLNELSRHTFIRVKGTPQALGLGTEKMELSSLFVVNDFFTKKCAILKGLGYGWMPEYLVKENLKKGTLRVLNAVMSSEHFLYPRVYHRGVGLLGNTSRELLKNFGAEI